MFWGFVFSFFMFVIVSFFVVVCFCIAGICIPDSPSSILVFVCFCTFVYFVSCFFYNGTSTQFFPSSHFQFSNIDPSQKNNNSSDNIDDDGNQSQAHHYHI